MADTESYSRRQETEEHVRKEKPTDDISDDEASESAVNGTPGRHDTDSEEEVDDELETRKNSKKMEGTKCEEEEDDEIVQATTQNGEDDEEDVYEMSRTPSPLDLMDDTPMMRKSSLHSTNTTPMTSKSSTHSPPVRAPLARSPTPERKDSRPLARSPTPERKDSRSSARSPTPERKDSRPLARSPTPERKDSRPLARSPTPERKDSRSSARSPTPERKDSRPLARSPTPERKDSRPLARSPTPERKVSRPLARSPTPERKDSRGSNGSSSYDDERASSLSPEPVKKIETPSSKVTSPSSPAPSSQSKSALTKIYTEALGDSDSEDKKEKAVRSRPAGDITQIYTQTLVEKEQQAASPRTERKSMTFQRPEGMTNITDLYTAAFKEDRGKGMAEKVKPLRNGNIAKLYTGGLEKEPEKSFKGKPKDELTHPTKHNMATSVDKSAIMEAYNEVMADNNDIDWAAFTFDGPKLGVTATGEDFTDFKSHFGPDDRGFGYIKIKTGDEMSRRSKFAFCTWVGPNVSVMKKAKMSTDKALLKDIIQNLSVELQIETAAEFTLENFKAEVDKAGGARYGTGVRE